MKSKIFIILFLLAFSISAQDFYGKATYKTHRKSSFKLDSTQVAQNPDLQKQLEAQMSKMFQKTFELNFTRTESTYKEDVQLNSPTPQSSNGGVMVMSFGGGGGSDLLYKNIKENRIANKVELMSKVFLVKDDLVKYEWKLTGETKNIGTYTCYKAIFEREIENTNMDMVDGDLKKVTKKEMRKTIAWYTPEVPVNNGPDNYWGLPGLILEINDGNQTIVCTEIIMNPTKKVKIEEPTKGKVVSREKFSEISLEKIKEMMNRNRSRDGKGFEIRIGG
tara:strand:- start:12073 stop:12903 length:831 start_codon:yes stop_codon:yes gene_type:complete